MAKTKTINDLPTEIIQHILSFIPISQFQNVLLSARLFNEAFDSSVFAASLKMTGFHDEKLDEIKNPYVLESIRMIMNESAICQKKSVSSLFNIACLLGITRIVRSTINKVSNDNISEGFLYALSNK
jgi:hypothetical protein